MKNNGTFYALIFLFCCSTLSFGQDFLYHSLQGRVISADNDVSATHVLNISASKAGITDAAGFFTITAKLYDTLVFSAIQFKTKQLVVSQEMLASKSIFVTLEASLTELDEVIVMPYNLSGELKRDMNNMQVTPALTAASLGLPNSNVKVMPQSERQLYSAQNGGSIIKVLNIITGETKRLKEFAAEQRSYRRTEFIRRSYHDTLYVKQLKIPKEKIDDFMHFCEIDAEFARTRTNDKLRLWEIMLAKSVIYRKNNALERP
tara:strand:- start:70516 stop:71298 length:783 start_codon:yes stop_codon:yes gene_type:complete